MRRNSSAWLKGNKLTSPAKLDIIMANSTLYTRKGVFTQMITIERTIDLPDTYPLDRLGTLEKLLFFDIETTGFSGDYSNLYLIGCTYFRDGSWHLTQWFADKADSEEQLLHAFFRFLNEFDTVVHFNGDGFDIPYLLKRCRAFHLPYDFSGVTSIDIYKRIKPYRKLLELENLKQKSIERFLGIYRQDKYSGGQLIEVYKDYLVTHEDALYDMLMLHNREDLEGMPLILPIMNYPDFLEHDFQFHDARILERPDLFGQPQPVLVLTLESQYEIPVSFEHPTSVGNLKAEGCGLTLEIDLFQGTLKYFYPDYKDYYYLIYEDTAVHKSIGEFVDKSARKKATAQTCYTKREGLFLPQPIPVWEPALKKEYKDKITYTGYHEELFQDTEKLREYVRAILSHVG